MEGYCADVLPWYMAGYGRRIVALFGFFLVGLSCRSTSSSSPSADSLRTDTVRPADLLTASLKAFQSGDTLEAFRFVREAIRRDSLQPFAYEVLGFYYYTQGRDSEALAAYQQALERGGSSPQLHYRIGAALLVQKRWAESYRHLLRADTSQADTWIALGLLAKAQNNLAQAAAFWKKALALDSAHPKARTFLYDLYLNDLHQPDTAKKYYLDPYWRVERFDPLLNFQLGNYHLKKLEGLPKGSPAWRKHAMEAINAYSQAILAYPSHAQAYYNRGYVYFLGAKYDRALEDFVRAAELNPNDARAWFMQGSLYELRAEWEKAQKAYARALTLKPDWVEAQTALKEVERKLSP